jgi:endonuclease/exonuclease/phosphatase family metal-dependent hydrolase
VAGRRQLGAAGRGSSTGQFASQFPEPRIIGGDLNAQIDTPEVGIILQQYNGDWDKALSDGTAKSYPDNPPEGGTRTRRSRIDHVFYSKGATNVSVTGAEIPDQRAPGTGSKVVIKIGTSNDYGVRPSDHNFMEVSLDIN